MTDTIDLLKMRRSVPPMLLDGPGPDEAQLETILRLGARVPDHGKLAPWRFIVFEGDARLRAGEMIGAIFQADYLDAAVDKIAQERKRLAQAPLVIGVVSRAAPHVKIPEWEQVLSAGAACMNIVVAANAMGFAASWLTQWYAYDRRVMDALGLAPHEKFAGFIHIGRAGAAIEDRARPDMAQIVSRFGA
jgi:nitroreductase